MTMPTGSSNLSVAHLNRTKVVIAYISAAHTTMSELGSIYYIWDDPSKNLTRLLIHVLSKYRHFQQRTSNAKRCPLRKLLLRRVLTIAVDTWSGGRVQRRRCTTDKKWRRRHNCTDGLCKRGFAQAICTTVTPFMTLSHASSCKLGITVMIHV